MNEPKRKPGRPPESKVAVSWRNHGLAHWRRHLGWSQTELAIKVQEFARDAGMPIDKLSRTWICEVESGMPVVAKKASAVIRYLEAMIGDRAFLEFELPPSHFCGREALLERLVAASKRHRVIVLKGIGGIGKSTLASALVQELKADFSDGQFLLPLRGFSTSPTSALDSMATVIRAFRPEVRLPSDERTVGRFYQRTIKGRRLILVADDARLARQVTPLVPPEGSLLIVTSRWSFHVPESFRQAVPALDPAAARQLLGRVSRRALRYADEVVEICHGHPLALYLVGCIFEVRRDLRAADLLKRFQTPANLLRLRHSEGEDSLQSVLAWSYDLLPVEAKSCWRKLSVFPGSFDESAAMAIWGCEQAATEESFDLLVSSGMVEGANGRYRLHDILRLLAAQYLEASDAEEVRARHATHYMEVLRSANLLYQKGGEGPVRALSLFDRERHNIEAGFAWLRSQDGAEAKVLRARYVRAGSLVLPRRLLPNVVEQWLTVALDSARGAGQRGDEFAHANNLGCAFQASGQYVKAIEMLTHALALSRELGHSQYEPAVLGNLGICYHGLKDYERAKELHAENLALAVKARDRTGQCIALGNLGAVLEALGDAQAAITLHRRSLRLAIAIEDLGAESSAYGNLGTGHFAMGRLDRALEYHDRSLEIARRMKESSRIAISLFNRAEVLYKMGREEEAKSSLEKSIAEFEGLESEWAIGHVAEARAKLREWQAQRARALSWARPKT